ncbi:c-type cytochrome [Neoroseomonas lacus]|uniref:c-type cytochrome n=1 Tax=Neoroseomonas lacus TaxID=287609 RepID=UPI001665E7F0
MLALPSGAADLRSAGAQVFAENCIACHGENGTGGLGTGAPSLAGGWRIYGGDRATILTAIHGGRQGVMPSWTGRLSAARNQRPRDLCLATRSNHPSRGAP